MTTNTEEHLKSHGLLPNTETNNDDTENGDALPNYIMVCHECGHQITRDRACKTTKQAQAGENSWKGCGHPIYFTRNAIDGLRDEDILEALTYLDEGSTITIEAEAFGRLEAHVTIPDHPDERYIDILYHGFSDVTLLDDDEDGHFPFNRGILVTGYHTSTDSDSVELIEPAMENMTKNVNQDLGNEDTPVQLLELSTHSR